MNQPMGRVVALQYRSKGPMLQHNVLRVHIRTHLDTVEYHDLPNQAWAVQCPALQFMALHGFRPSDLDEPYTNVEDETLVLPIAPMPPNSWGLAQQAMSGGEQALREAEWFEGLDTDPNDETDSAPAGGGSPDPGTGNRAGVEEPSDVEAEVDESVETVEVVVSE